MQLAESAENYLENILILQERIGDVRSVDLANEMGFSKPSVSRAVHLLEDQGLLDIADSGFLLLTEKGEEIAEKIYERHVFLTEYFMALGVDEETAANDACSIEHCISDITFDRMKTHIQHCAFTCPNRPQSEHFFKFNRSKLTMEGAEEADEEEEEVEA